jgi:hypothetical protein
MILLAHSYFLRDDAEQLARGDACAAVRRSVGIDVFVPPSAAEPWISEHPVLVRALETMDRVARGPLAPFGDHVLYWFERTKELCDAN